MLRRARGGREAEVRRVEELHQLVARADGQIELLRCHGTRYVRHARGWCAYGARTVAPRPTQAALSLGTHSVQEAGMRSPYVRYGGSWEARVNTGHSLRSSVLSSFASASERMSFEASVLTTESCMPAALRKRRSSASVTVSMDRPPPLPPPPVLAVVVIRALHAASLSRTSKRVRS